LDLLHSELQEFYRRCFGIEEHPLLNAVITHPVKTRRVADRSVLGQRFLFDGNDEQMQTLAAFLKANITCRKDGDLIWKNDAVLKSAKSKKVVPVLRGRLLSKGSARDRRTFK
jgi:hypothetical protein